MKAALLPLSFLLLVLFTKVSPIISAPSVAVPVEDVDGERVRVGDGYFILPFVRGRGGGLTFQSSENDSCPLTVVQETGELIKGEPVKFQPSNPHMRTVFYSDDLNIQFVGPKHTGCDESKVWRLLKVLTGVWFIRTGGVEGNPGAATLVNWFKIEPTHDSKVYTLSFCPKVCNCSTLCSDLGIYTDANGKRHLALGDKLQPFPVMFKKA